MAIDRTKFLALAFGLGLGLTACGTTQKQTRSDPAPNEEGYYDPGPPDPCGEGDCTEYPDPEDERGDGEDDGSTDEAPPEGNE